MRIARLDLERYGPFTDRGVAFRPDAALHIVLGRNEAGKTSALAAITDLLFGFEPRSDANFLHTYDALRIGGTLITGEGGELRIRRRKGTRNTLVDDEDKPLDEAPLDRALGGIDRTVFVSAFGLSQEALRAGARAMLASGGEVNSSLYAAASGTLGMLGVREALEAEADGLFGRRRSSTRRFYEVHDRYQEAKRALREKSLRGEALRQLAGGVREHEDELATISAKLKALAGERSRLARIRRTGRLLLRIDALIAERAALEIAGPDGEATALRIETALAEQTRARDNARRTADEVAALRERLAAMPVEQELLAAADEISQLAEERAALVKAGNDLERRVAEARALEDKLAENARRLGLADRNALSRAQPDDLTLERGRATIELRRRRDLDLETAQAALKQAEGELAVLSSEEPAGTPPDDEALRARLQALRPILSAIDAEQVQGKAVAERRARLDTLQAALAPPVLGGEVVLTTPLPGAAAIEAREAELADHQAALAQLDRDIAAVTAERTAAAAERDARQDAVAILDLDVLEALRARRDARFAEVLAGGDEDVITRYREDVAKADRLADARIAAASAVAEHDALVRRCATLDGRAEELAQRRAAMLAALKTRTAAWAAVFAEFGVMPGPPAQMRRWLTQMQQIRDETAALAADERARARLKEAIAAERPALDRLAADCGLTEPHLRTPATLMREIEARLTEIEAAGREGRKRAAARAAAAAARARAVEALATAQEALAETQAQWQSLAAALGLPPEARVSEAALAMDLWQGASTDTARLADFRHRIDTITSDRTVFSQRVAALCRAHGFEAGEDMAAVVAGLSARLERARQAKTRADALAEQLELQEQGLALAEAASRAAGLDVEALAAGFAIAPDDLPARAGQLRRADGLDKEIAALRRDIVAEGDGLDEAALRAEREGMSAEDVAAREQELDREFDGLAAEDKQRTVALGELQRRMAAHETGAEAAMAAQDLENARGDLDTITRDYLVRRAAALMIGTGIEQQLRGQQGPLVEQAGRLFATMTLRAFVGLAIGYDEDSTPELAARRADGASISVSGLSEGTRDQLFLALRLASLASVARRGAALPFIGDDLLMTFDEARVGAAISALADSSLPFQKILFTHHAHVAEIAREQLGDSLDLVTLRTDGAA